MTTKYLNSVIVNPHLNGLADLPYFQKDTPVIIDVETLGLNPSDKLLGIGLTQNGSDLFYYTEVPDNVREIIETYPLVGHNIKFDFKVLLVHGFKVRTEQIAGDTMLMSYAINPTKDTHALKPLANELLQMKWNSYEELTTREEWVPVKVTAKHPDGKKLVKTQLTLDQLPVDVVADYNGMDILSTWCLYQKFKNEVPVWYSTVELPLLRLLIKMELAGVHVDTSYFAELYEKFEGERAELAQKIFDFAKPYVFGFTQIAKDQLTKSEYITAHKSWSKGAFNPSSPQQKLTILNFMGINVDSSDKKILVKHAKHPFVKLLLDYSELASIINKFLDSLIQSDGKISTTYNQVRSAKNVFDDEMMVGIRSGRLSSSGQGAETDLNLQQIPSRSEKGKQIRKGFVAPEGKVYVGCDYSMIELRLIAHYSQEPTFCKAFQKGLDLHQLVADELDVPRSSAKQANFLVAYGGGPKKLSDTLNLPFKTAKDFFDSYWSNYHTIQDWKVKVIESAKAKGYVQTIAGRKIMIPELQAFDYKTIARAERQAVSYLIQGSASDIIKMAMLACEKAGYMPCLTVHDELGFYLDNSSELADSISEIKGIMEGVITMYVPLVCDMGSGKSWGEAKK